MIQKKYFCLALFIFFISRIYFFNQDGLYFFSDESRYDDLVIGWKETFRNNDFTIYLDTIFNLQARPGYGIIYALPAYLEQRWEFLPFGAILNILVSSLNITLVFLIIKKVQDYKSAILASILLLFSTTSVVYMRHMLPYDVGLLFLLISLYAYLSRHSLFITGILLGIAHLIYPSYFYYYLPLPILLLLERRKTLKSRFTALTVFTLGFLIPILITEITSIFLSTKSYLEASRALSGTVVQGDFMSFTFFMEEYIYTNDGLVGIFAILTFISILLLSKQIQTKFRSLIIYTFTLFLVFETFSHIFHITVAYGRTVRPFYWLLLVLAVIFLGDIAKHLKNRFSETQKLYIYMLVTLVITINAMPKLILFKNLIYPSEFRQEAVSLLKHQQGKHQEYGTITTNNKTDKYGEIIHFGLESDKLYMVNADSIYPYFGSKRLICNKQIIIEKPHIQAVFEPYLFEGFSKKMREYIEEDPPKYQFLKCLPS